MVNRSTPRPMKNRRCSSDTVRWPSKTRTTTRKTTTTTTTTSTIMRIAAFAILALVTPSSSLAVSTAVNGSSTLTHSSTTATTTTSTFTAAWLPTQGPIAEGVQCTIEDLERANDSQLHTILMELVQTNFFKTIVVDLQHTCPLRSWRRSSNGSSGSSGHEEDSPGEGKPQEQTTQTTTTKSAATVSKPEEEEPDEAQEETVECPGGAGLDLDEDAIPLCTVDLGDDSNPFGGGGGGGGGGGMSSGMSFGGPGPSAAAAAAAAATTVSSNVLQTLQSEGFTSPEAQQTFQWTKQTDIVVTSNDNDPETTPCSTEASTEDAHLPDTFWMDMCTTMLQQGDGAGGKIVNLALNPERNTGYNGTHIWNAIYEENCILSTTSSSSGTGDSEDNMCLEERVLYRLLSGLHTSTTLSIAKNFYPPSQRKNRTTWQANPQYFMERFEHHPDRIRNLHFSYVVLLRALRKASGYLHDYATHNIRSGNIVEDETSEILLRRLLDSAILQSCSSVFSAFDESLMFHGRSGSTSSSSTDQGFRVGDGDERQAALDRAIDSVSLQQNFKGVFHNISSILDCVQCQQCKLHGKMAMLGYGAALKILFLPSTNLLQLDRNEVVALINTIAKLSESMRDVRELTMLYWEQEQERVATIARDTGGAGSSSNTAAMQSSSSSSTPLELLDTAVGLVASLGRSQRISAQREEELIVLALGRQEELLILAKHYHLDPDRFVTLATGLTTAGLTAMTAGPAISLKPDAIVIGSGLAGLSAALNILDRGGSVVIVEKEHLLGGNSNKASSGINACCPPQNSTTTTTTTPNDDNLDTFRSDTIKSAGDVANLELIETLVANSAQAVTWLQERAGVDLSLKSQLGGHSYKRTHRPSNGMAGAEIIYHMQKAVKAYQKSGKVKIIMDTKVTNLLTTSEQVEGVKRTRVRGVQCENLLISGKDDDTTTFELYSDNIVLATGGFAADRSAGSYMEEYRPEYLAMPATAGAFSTGDGIELATAIGAGIRDMDKVQIHPTGWVDPADPTNLNKILAAELMRGVGGVLINRNGRRFCNELGTRAYVTEKMLSQQNPDYATTKQWKADDEIPTFSLVLSSSAAEDAGKHVGLYTHKGLLTKLEGIDALAKWMGVSKSAVVSTLQSYQKSAQKGKDDFGKTEFRGVPITDLSKEVFYAGTVTPVLHYCMGGITIDKEGNVLQEDGTIILGLHAAGEVTGGVHGENRLGGNSLLECTVYGTIVGQKIPIQSNRDTNSPRGGNAGGPSTTRTVGGDLPTITMEELAKHNTADDLWVAVHGVVYDFTDFAEEHPAGPESIRTLAGTDGTVAFSAVHNQKMLDDFKDERKGVLQLQ
jgi:flavocytochrome c